MSNFELGIDEAEAEMRHLDFDILSAICSFDGDPADSPFQHGYLYALISAQEAEATL